jgi:DNA-binding MltR family transcriptional regulator
MADADDAKLEDLVAQLTRNADAGTALVTVAVIDEWLQKLLLTAMRPLSNTVAERMFESGRPLYDVAPKADIAYAFKLIEDETLSNLRTLKKIRDLFAHTRQTISFSSPEIVQACRALPGFTKDANLRLLFALTAAQVIKAIDFKTQELIFGHAVIVLNGPTPTLPRRL